MTRRPLRHRSPGLPEDFLPENQELNRLPVIAVVPGLLFIIFVDIVTVLDVEIFKPYLYSWSLIIAVLPWVTLLLFKKTPVVFGYTRKRLPVIFGWGMVAGAVWRGLSMGFLYSTQIGWNTAWLFGMIIWIPFVEETFFRAYLGGGLARIFGRWPAIILQATLFSLHPAHWSQGWLDVISIFSFGILSGWLYHRFQSIWAPWGAHALANFLPYFLRGLVV